MDVEYFMMTSNLERAFVLSRQRRCGYVFTLVRVRHIRLISGTRSLGTLCKAWLSMNVGRTCWGHMGHDSLLIGTPAL